VHKQVGTLTPFLIRTYGKAVLQIDAVTALQDTNISQSETMLEASTPTRLLHRKLQTLYAERCSLYPVR
jgi:hypothetical protein